MRFLNVPLKRALILSLSLRGGLVVGAFLLVATAKLSAQINPIELVGPNDVEIYRETNIYVPDVRVKGDFSALHWQNRGESFQSDKSSQNILLYRFRFDSIVQKNVRLRFSLTNRKQASGTNNNPYVNYSSEQDDKENFPSENSSDYAVFIDEVYLNYHHNPLANLKIGLQELAVGDRVGIIYRGRQLAVTQECPIGTWCYRIGISQNGNYRNDGFRFFSLSYPVILSGEERKDFWGNSQYDHKLTFEAYNVLYDQYRAPLALYGGTARWPKFGTNPNYSPYQRTDELNNPVFRDMHFQYWGFNLDWQLANFFSNLKYVQLSGKSQYYSSPALATEPQYSVMKKLGNWGSALDLELGYTIAEKHRLALQYFATTGNKEAKDATQSTPAYARTSQETAFYEVNKGTYGDANVYFSGYQGTGQGHTISNLTYVKLAYDYASSKEGWSWDNRLYWFQRVEPVYNEAGKSQKDIGLEFDSNIYFPTTDNFKIGVLLSYFRPGGAYSSNDNLKPLQTNKGFGWVGLRADYNF